MIAINSAKKKTQTYDKNLIQMQCIEKIASRIIGIIVTEFPQNVGRMHGKLHTVQAAQPCTIFSLSF